MTDELNLLGTPNFGVEGEVKQDLIYDESGGVVGSASPLILNKIDVNSSPNPIPPHIEMVKSEDIYAKNVLPDYKYGEDKYLKEISDYIVNTYSQHYSQNKFQATEFIIDSGHGTGFCMGNVMKYTQRYGKKGDRNEWRKDLIKVIHYAMMQLHVHDNEGNK